MTTENLLLTAGTAVLFYYCFFHKKANNSNSTLTKNDELELTLDNLITQINHLNNQIK